MKYENSMVKIADDIIRDQQTERKVQNQKQKWHDEYATLKFFRYICRNVGNLQEGEIQRLIWQLKQSDKKAVKKHLKGYAWDFDYEKMFSTLTQNPVCQKVCQKNKYTTINEQILKFAQNYPTSFKTASSDAPFFMNWCRLPIRSVLT